MAAARGELVTGGSPRYNIYATADGRYLAAAPLEDRFWSNFCDAIGLDPRFRDDVADPEASCGAVAEKIAVRTSEEWRGRFAERDVCCAIVPSVEEALADPHFAGRGLFAHRLNAGGRSIPALPVPIDPQLRGTETEKSYPALGEANSMLIEEPLE